MVTLLRFHHAAVLVWLRLLDGFATHTLILILIQFAHLRSWFLPAFYGRDCYRASIGSLYARMQVEPGRAACDGSCRSGLPYMAITPRLPLRLITSCYSVPGLARL